MNRNSPRLSHHAHIEPPTSSPATRHYAVTIPEGQGALFQEIKAAAYLRVTMPEDLTRSQVAGVVAQLRELANALAAEARLPCVSEPMARTELLRASAMLRPEAEAALALAGDEPRGEKVAAALDACARVLGALDEWREAGTIYLETIGTIVADAKS